MKQFQESKIGLSLDLSNDPNMLDLEWPSGAILR